jgi:hypothetical protein
MTGQLVTRDAHSKTLISLILPTPNSACAGAVVLEGLRISNAEAKPNINLCVLEARNYDLRYYAELTMHVITRPIVLSAYVFAVWSLTANIGITHAFLWSTGPLSNWLIWLSLAVLLSRLASNFRRTERTHRSLTEH